MNTEIKENASQRWIDLPQMPEDRIRVIAADNTGIIGDCFFGYASSPDRWHYGVHARIPVERWDERLWRYTNDECPCRLIPTRWMPFPKLP